jgi:hypothetical protein
VYSTKAQLLMRLLRPHMSRRRRAQISLALMSSVSRRTQRARRSGTQTSRLVCRSRLRSSPQAHTAPCWRARPPCLLSTVGLC